SGARFDTTRSLDSPVATRGDVAAGAPSRQYASRTMRRRSPVPPLDVAHVLEVRAARGLVAVFDVDGVLAPIAPTPDAARVPPATRRALRLLARRADTVVGIVSGRPLEQVDRLVGHGGFWRAGLHGAARRGPDDPVRLLWPRNVQQEGVRLA